MSAYEGHGLHKAIFVLVPVVLALATWACHPTVDRHIRSIHSTGDYEEYCLDILDPTVGSGFQTFLADTLYGHDGAEHPGDTWDQIDGTARVYWVPYGASSNCEQFATWIKYTVVEGGCGGFSCVDHAERICELGHCHYLKTNVTFNSDHVRNFNTQPLGLPRHIISHETGHVLGLDDPPDPSLFGGASSPAINPTSCRENFYGTVVTVQSVMHSFYYCDDYGAIDHPWSLMWDKGNVSAISDQLITN